MKEYLVTARRAAKLAAPVGGRPPEGLVCGGAHVAENVEIDIERHRELIPEMLTVCNLTQKQGQQRGGGEEMIHALWTAQRTLTMAWMLNED